VARSPIRRRSRLAAAARDLDAILRTPGPPRPDVVKRVACMRRWSSPTQIRTCAARPVVLFLTEMGSASVNTRDRILSDGVDLLSQVGLAGVTLGMLTEKVGLSKKRLFTHFLSKSEVQIALLNQAANVANAHVVAPAMRVTQAFRRCGHWSIVGLAGPQERDAGRLPNCAAMSRWTISKEMYVTRCPNWKPRGVRY